MEKDIVLNINTKVKMRQPKDQKPMQKERPDSYLSEKAKFLKKHKNHLIDKEVNNAA